MTIDWWTLGFQTVNAGILVWLLGRFFWRPVAAMIEQRRAAAQDMLAEAGAKRSEAAAALAEIDRTRAGFNGEREAMLAAAHEAADRLRAERLADAAKEAAALRAAAEAEIAKTRADAEKAWAERAGRLAVDIAGRLAARLDRPVVQAAFVDWLLEGIRAQPEPVRRAVAANGFSFEAITATPLDPAEQDRYRALIAEAFGAQPAITFRADPTLIAGIELHGPHLVVGNSWRADLDRILADIGHDGRT